MKKLLFTLAAVLVTASTFAQGTIRFTTRNTGVGVDAPVTTPDGAGFGNVSGSMGQLWLVVGGVPTTPLTPATTFRTGAAAAYVQEPTTPVTVPGLAANQSATVVLRAWAGGAAYGDAANTHFGQSAPITVTLGGDIPGSAPALPANLTGLGAFAVTVVPEPSTIALGLLGAAALLYRRRK